MNIEKSTKEEIFEVTDHEEVLENVESTSQPKEHEQTILSTITNPERKEDAEKLDLNLTSNDLENQIEANSFLSIRMSGLIRRAYNKFKHN